MRREKRKKNGKIGESSKVERMGSAWFWQANGSLDVAAISFVGLGQFGKLASDFNYSEMARPMTKMSLWSPGALHEAFRLLHLRLL